MTLHRPVCDLLGCAHPVMLAGMGGVARGELVAAVAQAGGFGFLGMVREPPELIRAEVAYVRARTGRNFGVNLIPAATGPALLEAQVQLCIELRVPVVGLFWDLAAPLVARLRAAAIVVVCQVGSVDEALAAEAAGADAIIAQGCEAGGHVRGETPLHTLLPEAAARLRVPLLAAGGLATGADVATAMALGAQGAVLGTAMLATREAFAHDYHKQRIVAAQPGDTVLTEAFHINWPRGAKVRVLANSVTRGAQGDPFAPVRRQIGEEEGRPIYLFSTDSPLRSMTGDFEAMALYAGMGVGRIADVPAAGERLRAIVADAAERLGAGGAPPAEPAGFASPACAAREMDDAYMGFAPGDELLAALNELLEAERAGARVALQTIAQVPTPVLQELLHRIHRDEARWCGVLTRAVLALGGQPSGQTGAFHQKAMAIPDVPQRLVFLNKGQAWVVRKLAALLPRIRAEEIHHDLSAMLAAHEESIRRVEAIEGI